ADLEPKLQKRREKLEIYGLTLQPTVVIVGSIVHLTSFYVIVNNVKYASTSVMNAINLCFQTFFALNASYPADSEVVWYFLQKRVYSITKQKYQPNFITVDTTWHDIQQLMLTHSEYKRNKLLTDMGHNIKPVKIFFGTMEVRNNIEVKTQNVYGQLIPLRKVLEIYFEISDVFTKTCEYIAILDDAGEVSNIIQTDFWKPKIGNTSKENSFTFPLFLYEDAFKIANPLGSHAGIYKCGMYISIPCLPRELHSKLNNIFLAQLYHAHNLGLHSILGFVESFSATFCCRFCKVPKDISCKLCSENFSALRNKINYAQDIATNNVSFTGIKEMCAFNILDTFHAVENYSVDVMHDLLEGVCVYEMNSILRYCIIEEQYFTLDTLNWRLQFFNFGPVANRPLTISKSQLLNKSITMSASEMLSLILNFGLIVGDLIINPDDKYWQLFILLRKIL
ncbi:hypothetical protein EAI_10271, partial [Harpegnathos saltator]